MKRREAKILGMKFYYTGKPCRRGHLSRRRTSSGQCAECARENNQEYMRQLRASKPDVVNACKKAFYQANPTAKSRHDATYRERNREKLKGAKRRQYLRNRDVRLEKCAAWKVLNKGKVNATVARREATKRSATPTWANLFFVEEAYAISAKRTEVTGIKFHVDHVVPLRHPLVCGLHCEFNLRVITAKENLSKQNRYWDDMP